MPTKKYYWKNRERCIEDAVKWNRENTERIILLRYCSIHLEVIE